MRILCSIAVLALTGVATAQITPVASTGCPGFAAPDWTGRPDLGQTVTVTAFRRPSPGSFAVILLGLPSGGGLAFDRPTTCIAGPCVLYPMPFGNSYVTVLDTFMAQMSIAIPNDRRLIGQTVAIQGGFTEAIGNCFTLMQAVSLTIQQ